MFLNIHSHQNQLIASENQETIFNYIVPQDDEALATDEIELPRMWISAGIHPWYIHEKKFETQLQLLKTLAKNPSIKLIGECGLDRLKGTTLALQETIFIKQIRIAEAFNKPMIIHCVKCFNELISIKKIVRPKVPMIVHGFNNNANIAQSLIERGFYLSLGAALLQENSNASQIIQQIPLEKLFLETDDKDISIEKVYEKASILLKIPINTLEDTIFANYLSL